MNAEQTKISVLYLRSLFEYLESNHVDPTYFLPKAGYSADLINDFDQWTPIQTIHDIWDFAAEYFNDKDIGLHVGENATIGRWGLVEYLVLNSGSLREIISNASKYWRLILDSDKTIVLDREGKMAKLSFFAKGIDCRYFYDADLVYSMRLIQQVLSPHLKPTEVRLAYKKPKDITEYRRIFSGRIKFENSTYSVLFPYKILDQPLPKSNPILLSILQEHASGVLDDITGNAILADKVERFIQLNLPHISIDRVAEHLYLSVRTLQRKLKEEQKSFRDILDETRKKKAQRYLAKKNISLAEVAFMLGFSEPSSFSQAVKRWFGMTPGSYRLKIIEST